MTDKERSHKFYQNRKDNGLCPRCGELLDRDGHYCSKCLKKHNEYKKQERQFLKSMHICTECRKERVYGSDIICPECRAKNNNRRKELSQESKDKFKVQQRGLYKERKEQGICTRCGKRKSAPGRKKCRICLEKDSQIHRLRYQKKQDIRKYRIENNLCYRCGETLDREGKYCSKCQSDVEKHLSEARGTYWKQDNNIVFRGR